MLEEPTEGVVIRYIRGYDLISSDSAAAKTYYHYTSDNLGSITHITDEDGNILNRYGYDAFGNFTQKEETIPNRFCYTGEQYDPITSQYYLRARFYNPVIGRFLNEDTYYGDGLNLYTYCHNNPVVYIDPSGNMSDIKMGLKGKNKINWSAHNVVNYAKLKEQYKVSELANKVVDSIIKKGVLPSNYITKSQARAMGWSEGKALNNYAPGKAIGGDIFGNTSGVLPSARGRVWYEADVGVDYSMSRSNKKNPAYRILYSNDGLIYGTYDHYESVFPIYP